MRLEGKTALITGGANGIGAGCARRLAGDGANVVIADIDAASGHSLEAELAHEQGDAPGRVIFAGCDITQRQEVEALFARSVATLIRSTFWSTTPLSCINPA